MELTDNTCNWFRDAIVYHILIDRFAGYDVKADAKKPVFIGGNFKGITDKLDYLTDLGINTLWLSPVNETTAYHGYHVINFYSTDGRFGSENDLKTLISKAHQKNIRVLIDFVPNHCSHQHPYFIQALKDSKSSYRPWFYFTPFTNRYLSFLDYNELPKINLDFPAARDHLTGAARHWLSLGIDGFRLDHAVGPSHLFWRYFRAAVKSVNPEAVLIGEAWLEGIKLQHLKTIQVKRKYLRYLFAFKPWDIQLEYAGEMDGVLDFYFQHRITEFIAWKENPSGYETALAAAMAKHYQRFPAGYFLPTFIDNHDMNRFLFTTGQNRDKLKQALAFQFSLPQPPILYYGTETGLTHDNGVHGHIPFSDIEARQPMPWDNLDYELIDYCKELIRLRLKIKEQRIKI